MKNSIFLTGIALSILTPSIVMAQEDGCRRDGNGRIVGTVIGAGAGGVLGNVVAGRGDKTEGAIIGAIVGAVIGNQVSNPTVAIVARLMVFTMSKAVGTQQASARPMPVAIMIAMALGWMVNQTDIMTMGDGSRRTTIVKTPAISTELVIGCLHHPSAIMTATISG
jgi:hypothetical protein